MNLPEDAESRAIVRQSDLGSYGYCPAKAHYERSARDAGYQPKRLSATILGSVKHYALQVFQQLYHEGREDAQAVALATFEHYWSPEHCGEICEGFPTEWMRGHTYEGCRQEGLASLTAAFAWIGKERSSWLLGVEHTFNVPFDIGTEGVLLHGTVDRLTLRKMPQGLFVCLEDWKSGKVAQNLSLSLQWTVYAVASLSMDFWLSFYAGNTNGFDNLLTDLAGRGQALHQGADGLGPLEVLPRRGRLLSVRDGAFGAHDCGIRTEAHYERLRFHIREYLKARRADVNPPTTDCSKCLYCEYSDICGQAPVPELQDTDQNNWRA